MSRKEKKQGWREEEEEVKSYRLEFTSLSLSFHFFPFPFLPEYVSTSSENSHVRVHTQYPFVPSSPGKPVINIHPKSTTLQVFYQGIELYHYNEFI